MKARLAGDTCIVTIDGKQVYEVPLAAIKEVEPMKKSTVLLLALIAGAGWTAAGAKQALETALELDPDYEEARSLLEEVSARVGPGEAEPEETP